MKNIFIDEGDHKFFDKLMERKSTIIVSIQVNNTITEQKK